ncbi:hypothetical protein IB256_27450 [Pseudomonas sp. PDM17]|uniref:hypothetical protein n=1 Tax=Pseudomonas sp. PDM17 TaxID=2769285 RepID=UPI0017877767|nr:hypothetical protein [Pseudomonas sp. PDM17]MBD9504545.1 hypothetical protein [Pseudomonas sp. PDM17]
MSKLARYRWRHARSVRLAFGYLFGWLLFGVVLWKLLQLFPAVGFFAQEDFYSAVATLGLLAGIACERVVLTLRRKTRRDG